MDYKAFSHGQIHSKIWLCEQLEPYIPKKSNVAILGSWYNVLGLMMLIRNQSKYNSIIGIDIDDASIPVADKICESWNIQPDCILQNHLGDVNQFDYNGYNIIINCSTEHMESNEWFNLIPATSIICLQTSNVINDDPTWNITNPNKSLEDFVSKYPMRELYFSGEKEITYDTWGYKRYMLIGKK